MGLMTRLAAFIAAEPRQQRAMFEMRAAAGSMVIPWTVGKAQYLPHDLTAYDRDAYRKIALIFRAVQIVADAVATAPLRVYQDVDGEPQELAEHPLRQLFERPNEMMGEARFMSFLTTVMSVHGFVLLEKERDTLGNVIALWPMRSDWARPIPRQNAAPDWEYRIPGIQTPFIKDAEDVIPITYADTPDGSYTGMGPLEMLVRQASITNSMVDFIKNLLDNGAVPMYGIVPSDDPNIAGQFKKPGAREAFMTAWRQQYGNGLKGAADPVLLLGAKDIKRIGMDLNELAYEGLNKRLEVEICEAFGIPPILLQTQIGLEHGTYSNYKQARTSFYEDRVTPLWARYDDAFSRNLLNDRDFVSDISLEFDTTKVPALREDQTGATERAVKLATAGIISTHAAARLAGVEPQGADVFLRPFSAVEVPVDGAKPLPKPTAQIGDTPKVDDDEGERGWYALPPGTYASPIDWEQVRKDNALMSSYIDGRLREGLARTDEPRIVTRDGRTYLNERALAPAQRAAEARVIAMQRQTIGKLADVLAPEMDRYFEGQKARLVASLTDERAVKVLMYWRGKDGSLTADDLRAAVEDVSTRAIEAFDWTAEADELRRLLEAWLGEVEAQAMAQTAAMIGGGFTWDVANPLLASLQGALGTRIRLITEETRQRVEAIVRDSLLEGTTMPDLAGKLETLFDATYANRHLTVARTESSVAYGRASALAYERSGVVSRAMLADNPDHTEAYKGAADGLTCAQRNRLVVAVQDIPFHVESDHPNGTVCAIPLVDDL